MNPIFIFLSLSFIFNFELSIIVILLVGISQVRISFIDFRLHPYCPVIFFTPPVTAKAWIINYVNMAYHAGKIREACSFFHSNNPYSYSI